MTDRVLGVKGCVARALSAKPSAFRRLHVIPILTMIFLGHASASKSHEDAHEDHALGTVQFPISCSTQAQVDFNRAVALLHHMTYPQAREAFQRITTNEPQCAMAYWGVAMTLFQPLWPTRPSPEALKQGWEAVQTAKALPPPTERERGFIAATAAFFLDPASADYWLRIRRWEQAMEQLYARFPDDTEVAAFYALSHLATMPSDRITSENSERAAAILLKVYQRNPDHPGAMHYLVHANDVPGREKESLDITKKYEIVAPNNPHALHMPTHIYTRLGEWRGVVRANLRAADAALLYPAGDHKQFVWDEFPHAIEYLIYAYLQQGADDAAAAQLQRLRTTSSLEPTFKTAFHLASTQARYALERHAWDEAAKIVPREPTTLNWDRFTWPEAIAVFAHGLGAAHLGDLKEAKSASARLESVETKTANAGEVLFARNIRLLRLELNAWLAQVEGQAQLSRSQMKEAVALEVSTPKHAVTPGPTLPAHELLGDLLVEQNDLAEALAAYQNALALYPGRFNSLLGAARAADKLGDRVLARANYQALLDVADQATHRPALEEAASYIGQSR